MNILKIGTIPTLLTNVWCT